MKLFLIESIAHVENIWELAGRNCRDAIRVGDELTVQNKPTSVVRVAGIEVYRKSVDELHHGYVGTLFVECVMGDCPDPADWLVETMNPCADRAPAKPDLEA